MPASRHRKKHTHKKEGLRLPKNADIYQIMEIALAIISCFLVSSVFLSLIRNDFWIFKILEYPRIQKLLLILFVCACWYAAWPLQNEFFQVILAALVLSAFYLLYKIWPYTIFARKEMIRAKLPNKGNDLRIFSANVLQDNTQFDKMLQQIFSVAPDIIFLLETDDRWAKAMEPLKQDYPFMIECPLENTYGLLFYSRLKLENPQIKFLVKNDLPSVDTIVVLESGERIQLWGLHPEPPAPGESLYSTAKDKELMKVALKAKDCTLPCIVCGDLNDVAWSHTTELFRKTSQLLEPRRGRGF